MKFGKTEDWLNRKIDITRAKLEVSKPARPEVTDPVKIQEKLVKAHGKFSRFLSTRTTHRPKENVGFVMVFDRMAETLELSDLPSAILQAEMDAIVLSAPGIAKTDTSYIVSDPELLYENFGPTKAREKTIQFLATYGDKMFSCPQIAQEVGVDNHSINSVINDLVSKGKIILVEEQKSLGFRKGKIPALYKIAP